MPSFQAAFLREFELSLFAIDDTIEGVPYWNWFTVDFANQGDISHSSLWKYFGSYYGDPDNFYQIKGGEFADWIVFNID